MVERGAHGGVAVHAGKAVQAVGAPVVEAPGEVEVGAPGVALAAAELDFAHQVGEGVGVEVGEVVEVEGVVVSVPEVFLLFGVEDESFSVLNPMADVDGGVEGVTEIQPGAVGVSYQLDNEGFEARVVFNGEIEVAHLQAAMGVEARDIGEGHHHAVGIEGVEGVPGVDGRGIVAHQFQCAGEVEGALEGHLAVARGLDAGDGAGIEADVHGAVEAGEGHHAAADIDLGAVRHLARFVAAAAVGDNEGLAVVEDQGLDGLGQGRAAGVRFGCLRHGGEGQQEDHCEDKSVVFHNVMVLLTIVFLVVDALAEGCNHGLLELAAVGKGAADKAAEGVLVEGLVVGVVGSQQHVAPVGGAVVDDEVPGLDGCRLSGVVLEGDEHVGLDGGRGDGG